MKIIAEYIWLDSSENYRSKTKIFSLDSGEWWTLSNYPIWNYDGSSTNDIPTNDKGATECLLYPLAIYDDPFNINTDTKTYMLVLCNNTYIIDDHEFNVHCQMENLDLIKNKLDSETYLLGFEQEFFMINPNTSRPFGVTEPQSIKQGPYYCGTGIFNSYQRPFLQDTREKLLDAGIELTGFNYEVAPSQAEFQVCDYGIEAAYQLLILRYILERNGELFNIHISFSNVVYRYDNINNSGCHVNISNLNMRNDNGIEEIINKINELGDKTPTNEIDFNFIFGNNNTERLTGQLETSNWKIFDWGIGTRHSSIRVPVLTNKEHKGYFEDRRPGANVNPFNYLYHLLF